MISRLFTRIYSAQMDERYWHWRFEDNPNSEKKYIVYIVNNNELTAYYALSPTRLMVDGQVTYQAALMNGAMTHPDNQGRGLFVEMAKRLHGRLKEDGYCGVFGFANYNAHRLHRKHLGWHDLSPVHLFRLEISTFSHIPNSSGGDYSVIDEDVSEDNLYFAQMLRFSTNIIFNSRDHANLSWRLFKNPFYNYRILRISKNDVTIGLLIFKLYHNSIDIMEIFYKDDNDWVSVINNGMDYLLNKYKFNINIFSNVHTAEHLYFEKIGFREGLFNCYFGFIPFGEYPDLLDYSNWHFRFMDSDLF